MRASKQVKAGAAKTVKRRSMFQEAVGRLVRNPTAMFGLAILLTMGTLCALADVICPEGFNAQDIRIKFLPPGGEYLLGTDALGRSMLARILYGGRISLVMGFISTGIAAVFGITLGSIAGFYGGKVDNIIMRILDVFASIPNTLLAIAMCAALGGGMFNAMIAVGTSAVPRFARTARAPILAVKGLEYIEAARSIDANDRRIIFSHVIPNILSPVVIAVTAQLAQSMLTASSLSFLGLGVQAPQPEWGALIATARQFIRDYPHLVTFPGIAIASVVLSMNLFGDGLRDALDPKLKS